MLLIKNIQGTNPLAYFMPIKEHEVWLTWCQCYEIVVLCHWCCVKINKCSYLTSFSGLVSYLSLMLLKTMWAISPLTFSAQIINTKFCKISVNVIKIAKSIHSWVNFSKFIWYLSVILLIQNTTQTQSNQLAKLFFLVADTVAK